jgi:hypothetical protein
MKLSDANFSLLSLAGEKFPVQPTQPYTPYTDSAGGAVSAGVVTARERSAELVDDPQTFDQLPEIDRISLLWRIRLNQRSREEGR